MKEQRFKNQLILILEVLFTTKFSVQRKFKTI